jgi:DNA processing protein
MDTERLFFVALHFIPGLGDQLIKQLISYCGSATEVFKKPKGKLLKIPGIGEITAKAIIGADTIKRAEAELIKADKSGVQILFFSDKQYPARLKSIDDAPTMLYVSGQTDLNKAKMIGIVGTRQATTYGRENVDRIVEELVPHKATIVSGLAYGIDIHAHKQALKHNLSTVGVLGSGIDVIYPAAHESVARKMINNGAIITENHFGTKPDAHHFPARNRIIAGLCDALIVVEAAEKGGALITADIANSYNKDVFALPGNVGQSFSEGCNRLIKQNKAILFESVKDLEYFMNWSTSDADDAATSSVTPLTLLDFDDDELQVIKMMQTKETPMMIDELAWKTGLSQGQLASLLLTLEMKNAVQALPGKQFKLSRKH